MGKSIDFKTDNLWLLMIRMALPGIMGTLLVSINAFVDAIYVGYFIDQNALSGISLILPLTIITTAVMAFIAFGCSSVLSRAIGSGNVLVQQKVYENLFLLSLIASVILIILGYFFCEQFIFWMGGRGAILNYGLVYYQMYVLGTFFNIFGMASNSLIRALGNVRQAMTFTGVAVILNIALVPLLISVAKMGITGAALASIIAMAVYTFLTTRYLLSDNVSFRLNVTKLNLDKDILMQIANVGFSAFMLQVASFVRQAIMFRAMANYGSDADLAFFAAVYRIFSFSVIPVFGLLQSLQPIVGINYGSGNYERSAQAVRVFRVGGIVLLTLLWIPTMLMPNVILSAMLPDRLISTQELLNFRFVFSVIPLLPLASSGIIYFQAIGRGKLSTVLSTGREIILFVPLILTIPCYYGVDGIYYSIAAENLIYIACVFAFTQLVVKETQALKQGSI